jgi:DNA replication protein DnaC
MSLSGAVRKTEMHRPVPRRPWETNPEVPDRDLVDNQERRLRRGYAANPHCTVCRGYGFVHPMKGKGQPDYSRFVTCTALDCLADSMQHYRTSGQYLELKGVSSRLQTFEQFQRRPGTEKSLRAFQDLAEGKTDKPLLLCVGGTGCGKTHLCQALTTVLNLRGVDAYYYRVPDLLRTLRDSIEQHNTDEWMKSLAAVGGLIMDDYGLEHATDWTDSAISDVVDVRWEKKRLTVMTSNKDITELPARIKSRFGDTEVSVAVVNSGKDYRTGRK